jgi:hypothetical protein
VRLHSTLFALLLLVLGPCTAYPAWLYNAVDDRVVVSDNAALDLPNGNWAIVIHAQETSRDTSARLYVRDPFPTANNAISIYFGAGEFNDEIYVSILNSSGTALDITGDATPMLSGNPFTVIVERSGTTVTLYVNGTATGNTVTLNTALDTNVAGIIGNKGDFARGWRGNVHGFAIYYRALTTGEKTALSAPFSVNCNWNSLSAYVPAISVYVERMKGITVTNTGTDIVAHPRMFFCSE